MPRIPIIRNGQSSRLPSLPAAKLDRERRPIINLSGVSAAAGALGQAHKPAFASDALAAPDAALGAIGNGIRETGSILGALAVKRQEAQTDVQMAEANTRILEARGEFQTWMRDNPDPAHWPTEWDSRFTQLSSELENREGLTGGTKEQQRLLLTKVRGESAVEIGTLTDKRTFAMAASAFKVNAGHAIEGQRGGELEEILTLGESKNYLWPHEAEALRRAFDRETAAQQAESIVVGMFTDPTGMKQRLEGGEFNLSELERAKHINDAKRAVGSEQDEIYNGMKEAIWDGSVANADHLEGPEWEKLRPTQRATLMDTLGSVYEREVDGIVRSPAEQARIAGQLEIAFAGYEPADEEARDATYLRAARLLESVADPVAKKEYKRRLDSIRSNGFEDVKSNQGFAASRLKQLYQDGAFGEIPEVKMIEKTLGGFLDDGFLEDRDKLVSLGLSEKQAKKIEKADTMAERVKIFRESYPEREGEVTATEFEQRLAGTLRDSSSLTEVMHSEEDSASRVAVERRKASVESIYGRASVELRSWLNANPKASASEIGEKVDQLSTSAKSSSLGSGTIPQRPGQKIRARPLGKQFKSAFSTTQGRLNRAQSGGATILLDSNSNGTGQGFTHPLIVIPDNATPLQRKAAQSYVDRVAEIHRDRFGRNVKPRVVTKSANGRGRSNAFHTEGFAIHDTSFVDWLQTPSGKEDYMDILQETLGSIPGVQFTLPHGGNKGGHPDTGAEHNGFTEVDLAKHLMQ